MKSFRHKLYIFPSIFVLLEDFCPCYANLHRGKETSLSDSLLFPPKICCLNVRETPEFSKYFDSIWKELDVHA